MMDSKFSDGWETPIPVDRPKLPEFPVDALPPVLGDWVLAESEYTQTPNELAALLALAMCSGCVARRVVIDCGWREPIQLWVAVLLDPASRKSAVFEAAKSPLRAIERECIEKARPELSRAQAEYKIAEKQHAKAIAKAADGDVAARQEAVELQLFLDHCKPVSPKLFCDDAPAETIGKLLAEQSGRLILASAEGGIFSLMAGRYSKGVPNLDVFLKGHAGEELLVDRVSRDSIAIDRVSLTLSLAIQPEVLCNLVAKETFRGRGLLGRFLWAVPLSQLGKRKVRDVPKVPEHTKSQYEKLIRRLFAMGERIGEDGLELIPFDPKAAEMFLQWRETIEPWLGADGEFEMMRDWGGKFAGLTARLAGNLHLIRFDELLEPIGIESVQDAIAISKWAIPHARAAFGLLGADDGAMDDAERVLAWLKKENSNQTSRREIHQQFRSRFDQEPDRLTRALDVLIDRGWLRFMELGSKAPGRPSEKFECHPWVASPPIVSGVL